MKVILDLLEGVLMAVINGLGDHAMIRVGKRRHCGKRCERIQHTETQLLRFVRQSYQNDTRKVAKMLCEAVLE